MLGFVSVLEASTTTPRRKALARCSAPALEIEGVEVTDLREHRAASIQPRRTDGE